MIFETLFGVTSRSRLWIEQFNFPESGKWGWHKFIYDDEIDIR